MTMKSSLSRPAGKKTVLRPHGRRPLPQGKDFPTAPDSANAPWVDPEAAPDIDNYYQETSWPGGRARPNRER